MDSLAPLRRSLLKICSDAMVLLRACLLMEVGAAVRIAGCTRRWVGRLYTGS
jgi:hypothetical protein